MSKSRRYHYCNTSFVSIKCRQCGVVKSASYFAIRSDTGEHRQTCRACRARMKNLITSDERFAGVFTGLDLNPEWDLNSNSDGHNMIIRRTEAVRDLILREMRKRSYQDTAERTISDEIKAGKNARRSIRRLARSAMPLNLNLLKST